MKALLLSLFFSISLLFSYSQVNISTLALNTGGSFFEQGDYMISGNIGEMSLVNTFFSPEFIITNGVLQPLVLKRPAAENPTVQSLRIYPTITQNNYVFLESKLGDYAIGRLTIHNSIGQKCFQKSMVLDQMSQISKIELNSIGEGNFFIEVALFNKDGNRYYTQVFKIQKM